MMLDLLSQIRFDFNLFRPFHLISDWPNATVLRELTMVSVMVPVVDG